MWFVCSCSFDSIYYLFHLYYLRNCDTFLSKETEITKEERWSMFSRKTIWLSLQRGWSFWKCTKETTPKLPPKQYAPNAGSNTVVCVCCCLPRTHVRHCACVSICYYYCKKLKPQTNPFNFIRWIGEVVEVKVGGEVQVKVPRNCTKQQKKEILMIWFTCVRMWRM